MYRPNIVLITALVVSFIGIAEARIIHVPADYGTIQAGIDASNNVNGDTVLVASGTYSEHISFMGKDIVVKSHGGPGTTAIQALVNNRPIVKFEHGEPPTATLEGFTIRNAVDSSAVLISSSSATLKGNVFTNNHGAYDGGAVNAIYGTTLNILNNIFTSNSCTNGGGALRVYGIRLICSGNEFHNNSSSRDVGAIHCRANDFCVIDHNLFVGNSCSEIAGAVVFSECHGGEFYNNTLADNSDDTRLYGAGLVFWYSSNINAYNNIVVNNFGKGIYCYSSPSCQITYNDVWRNQTDYDGITPGEGSISEDPLFVGGGIQPYYLSPESPCINAGDPNSHLDPDSTRADMGAFYCAYTGEVGYIAGTALDSLLHHLPGVYVTAVGTRFRTETNDDGQFVLGGLPCGRTYNIHFFHGGYAETTLTDIAISANDTTVLDDLILPRIAVGSIAGTVFDSLQNHIQGVNVTVLNTNFQDTTDSMGRFFFDYLPNGRTYDLLFVHPDYYDTTLLGVPITPFDTTVVSVTMHAGHMPGFLRGYVSSGGSNLDGVIVRTDSIGPSDTTILGRYLLESISPGLHNIHFSHPRYQDTVVSDVMIPIGDTATLNITMRLRPSAYHVIIGNRDASPMPATLGSLLQVPIWGATDPLITGDTVTFMHIPLSTNDLIITERDGGYLPDTLVGRWDEATFWPPNPDTTAGWTSQSLLAFAYLSDPPDRQNWFFTNGDTVFIGTFRMQVTSDTSLVGDTIYPFKPGYHPANGPLEWGNQDGTLAIFPTVNFSPLYIAAPVGCSYIPGDVNNHGGFTGLDIVYAVAFLKGIGPVPIYSCECPPNSGNTWYVAGDVNGSCTFSGSDVVYMVNFFKGGPDIRPCTACPPSRFR